MKHTAKHRPVTFGDFIVAVYRAYGHRRAADIVRLAVNTQVITFRGQKLFITS